ncbi:hypothetical protein MRB53_002082 [Persea americana]|uniref:Uncharacterized protein n=1 Tax=Persea americana TaxID=3435 RepID=A0ACC2MTL7_PERAE|nr:hypothetical protein MRB53_002082 [Persea americana]
METISGADGSTMAVLAMPAGVADEARMLANGRQVQVWGWIIKKGRRMGILFVFVSGDVGLMEVVKVSAGLGTDGMVDGGSAVVDGGVWCSMMVSVTVDGGVWCSVMGYGDVGVRW